MVAKPDRREKFVASVVAFLRKHALDGASLDWEYPNWNPKIEGETEQEAERGNFNALLKEMREAFDDRWTLSASVSAGPKKIDTAYDVPKMQQYLDWINVMAYAWWTQSNKAKKMVEGAMKDVTVTGHFSAMEKPKGDENYMGNSERIVPYSIKYWIDKGMPRDKINLGTATYGKSFRLANKKNNTLNAVTDGTAERAPLLNGNGYFAYFEICDWNWDKHGKVFYKESKVKAPYASKDNLWVAYESPESMAYKVKQVVNKFVYKGEESQGVGGISFWALDLDDFNNYCSKNGYLGHYPLIRSAVEALTRDCNDEDARSRGLKGGNCGWSV